jgi:RNA-directed DNA polymerase
VAQGWINYYGRFYKSRLLYFLRRLDKPSGPLGLPEIQTTATHRERRAMAWLAEIALPYCLRMVDILPLEIP